MGLKIRLWASQLVSIHSFTEMNRFINILHYFCIRDRDKHKKHLLMRKWKKQEVAPKDKWIPLNKLNLFKIIPYAHNLLFCQAVLLLYSIIRAKSMWLGLLKAFVFTEISQKTNVRFWAPVTTIQKHRWWHWTFQLRAVEKLKWGFLCCR